MPQQIVTPFGIPFSLLGALDDERGARDVGTIHAGRRPTGRQRDRGEFEIVDCLPVEARELLASSRSVLAAA